MPMGFFCTAHASLLACVLFSVVSCRSSPAICGAAPSNDPVAGAHRAQTAPLALLQLESASTRGVTPPEEDHIVWLDHEQGNYKLVQLFEKGPKAAALAAGGCADSATPSLPFSCSPDPCTCTSLAAYCAHAMYGADVSRECPLTCNTCGEAPAPAPAEPASTLAPEMGARCTEPGGLTDVALGRRTYRGTCAAFSFAGLCNAGGVSSACPVSCGVCAAA